VGDIDNGMRVWEVYVYSFNLLIYFSILIINAVLLKFEILKKKNEDEDKEI